MVTKADQKRSSDFPLPTGSTQNPIRADFPRQLIVLDGEWKPCTHPSILAGMDYLAVSYRHSDFPDKKALGNMVRKICTRKDIKAYWIDFSCTGETPEEKNEDLYRFADVFRNAKVTLIMIKGEDGQPLSDGWLSWGTRIWTFPEALLSTTFILQTGLSNLLIKEMSLNQVANHAYGSENVIERKLIDLYSHMGKYFSQVPERFEMLCEAIWNRYSGPDFLAAQPLSAPTAYPAEKVYAMMGFLLHRILPKYTESEDEAFQRLLDENGLQCDQYPRIAYGSDGSRKLGVRDKKDTRAKESHILPPHVPEARFDYNGSGRRTCEAGTRVETLAKIYRWLGLFGYLDENDSSLHEEPETNVLWLKGLAGTGKSTIAQTAAEECDVEHILGATFFCSRSTAERSDYLNIFPTICRLLCQLNEDFALKVSEIYAKDKDLQRAEADRQLQKLILEPLKASRLFPPCVVIIDALDECSNIKTRSKILTALDKYVTELKPLKFLITSRPDYDINVAFKTLSLGDDTEKVNLDDVDSSLTDRDLKIVLNNGLIDVRKVHGLKEWPSEEKISKLVHQAQHLFVFVSTAVKFIGDSSASDPEARLNLLLRSRTITSKSSPYTYLDNLYREVFRSAFTEMEEELISKLQMVLRILVLGFEEFSISKLENFVELRPGTVRSTLLKLHALVIVPENDHDNIRLIHSSIHDFLTDEERCTDTRFVVKKAKGHSAISQCCFKTLAKFAKSERMRSFLEAPTEQKQESLKENARPDVKYSNMYWVDHLKNSDSSDEMMEDIEVFLSNRNVVLLARDREAAASALLELGAKLLKQPFSPSGLTPLLYQSAVMLLGDRWSKFVYIDHYQLLSVLSALHTEHGYSNGLFGLNERTVGLEVATVFLKGFVPIMDVLEFDAVLHRLKKTAEEIHNKIFHQAFSSAAIPRKKKLSLMSKLIWRRNKKAREVLSRNDKLYSDLSAVMVEFYQQLCNEVREIKKLDGDSDDYPKKLEIHLSALLQSMKVFNEIFGYILNNDVYNLDIFFTSTFSRAFSEADNMQIDVLRAILNTSLFGPEDLSFADLKGLQSLFHLPSDRIYTNLCRISLFVGALARGSGQIRLAYPSLFSMFLKGANRLDTRFLIDPIVVHSKIALLSMERLILFTSTPEMHTYTTNPSEPKWSDIRNNLGHGNDAALTYAYRYWIFHIDKSNGQLDELTLQRLSKLISHRYTLDILLRYNADARSLFLDLFNKLSGKHSPPSTILIPLYWAAMFLSTNKWPKSVDDMEGHIEAIKKARETLRTCFLYKDGLYELDTSFPLLAIAVLKLAEFVPLREISELDSEIRELRNCANRVHEMIMQQVVREDNSKHSALRECMSTLHEELKSRYEPYSGASWGNKEVYARALRLALSYWSKSLNEFQSKIYDIDRISDNVN